MLARVSRRGVPVSSIAGVSLVSTALAATGQTEGIFIVMVCGAAVSYLVMLAAFPKVEHMATHAGRTGPLIREWFLAAIAGLGSVALLASSFLSNPGWSGATLVVIALLSTGSFMRRQHAGR
jgi:hypothetical protein